MKSRRIAIRRPLLPAPGSLDNTTLDNMTLDNTTLVQLKLGSLALMANLMKHDRFKGLSIKVRADVEIKNKGGGGGEGEKQGGHGFRCSGKKWARSVLGRTLWRS